MVLLISYSGKGGYFTLIKETVHKMCPNQFQFLSSLFSHCLINSSYFQTVFTASTKYHSFPFI